MDFLKCILIFLVATFLYFGIGQVVSKRKNDFSYNYLLGYFIFTFIVAVPGIIVQVLRLPWMVYAIYYISVIVVFLVFIIKKMLAERTFSIEKFIDFFKQNYFLFLVSFILLFISFLYVWLFWANNHSDDGYYIGKIAEFPYMESPFTTNPVNGFPEHNLTSYTLNTWELQASVLPYIFGINPVVYARFYLNLITIFILVNSIKGFSYQIVHTFKSENIKTNWIYTVQYIALIAIFFSFNSAFFEKTQLFNSNDLWQFNSGLYLGSSIIRTSGFLILFMFYIDRYQITLKDVLLAIILSISFISKSSIALPLLVIFAIIHLIKVLIYQKKYKWILSGSFLVIILIISLFIPNNQEAENLLYEYLSLNIHSILFWIMGIIFILSFFYKNSNIIVLNLLVLIIFMLIYINPLNNIYELSSVYPFVGGRINLSFMYFLFVLVSLYFYLGVLYCVRKEKVIIILSLISYILLSMSSAFSFKIYTGSITDSLRTLSINNNFIPNSTIEVSNELDRLSSKKDLYVLAPYLSLVNYRYHTFSVSLRFWAPEIKVVSALGRFGTSEIEEYSTYTQEMQDKFDEFSRNPNSDTFESVKSILDNYYVNCIIVENVAAGNYLSEYGFTNYLNYQDSINVKEYSIFIR